MQTLYESWELRRQLLESKANPLDAAMAQAQKQILDYLLKRYRGLPIANVAAAFPARMELKIDRRAMVVHEHLVVRGVYSGVKNEAEATSRASRILKRISNLDPQSSVSAPGDGIFNDPLFASQNTSTELAESAPRTVYDTDSPPGENGDPALQRANPTERNAMTSQQVFAGITYRQRLAWGRIHSAIKAGDPPNFVYSSIRAALALGKALPERAITYLFDQCSNPLMRELQPAELMAQCINASVPVYALMAWRDRLAALAGPDAVADVLRQIGTSTLMRKSSLLHLRPYLADSHASVRLQAAVLLSDIGTLHDVGLLLDLSALPPQTDEDPSERSALLDAAKKLAAT